MKDCLTGLKSKKVKEKKHIVKEELITALH